MLATIVSIVGSMTIGYYFMKAVEWLDTPREGKETRV